MQQRYVDRFAPRDWDALKRAFEAHTGDIADLAAANAIQPTTLLRYARERNWVSPVAANAASRPPRAVRKPAAKSRRRCTQETDEPPTTRMLSRRLRHTISRQLERLEQIMDETPTLSTAEHERHSKAVGALVKNLETAHGLDRTDDDARGSAAAGAPEAAGHDADQLRRELAARIERLRERLAR